MAQGIESGLAIVSENINKSLNKSLSVPIEEGSVKKKSPLKKTSIGPHASSKEPYKQLTLQQFLQRIQNKEPVRERTNMESVRKLAAEMMNVEKPVVSDTSVPQMSVKKKNVQQKKDKVLWKTLPMSHHRRAFNHFSKKKYSKKILNEVSKVTETFFANVISDAAKVATVHKRNTIKGSDIVYLMKKQGIVDGDRSLNALVEEFLPLEMWPDNS